MKRPGIKLPEFTPTIKVACVAVAVAVVCGIVYAVGRAHDWMPSLVVGALTVAVTVTVIEGAIKREEQNRTKPLRSDVLLRIGESFNGLLVSIALDYAEYPGDVFEPMPSEPLEVIALWLSARKAKNLPDDWVPSLIQRGKEFADRLERHRRRDREVIPLDLITTSDRCSRTLLTYTSVEQMYYQDPDKQASTVVFAERQVVKTAREWLLVYNQFAPEPVTLSGTYRDIADKVSQGVIAEREDGPPSSS